MRFCDVEINYRRSIEMHSIFSMILGHSHSKLRLSSFNYADSKV